MINKVRRLNKRVTPAVLVGFVVLSVAAPALIIDVAHAAAFNQGSQPYKMLRTHNYSENGSCSTCWLDDDVTAGIGDIVTFQVFYNNTSGEIADDVEVRISPDVASDGNTVTVDARISADNASAVTDSVTVHAKLGEDITGFEQSGSAVHMIGTGGSASISNASNIESGSGIGDIAADNTGFVYARFRVIGEGDPSGDEPDVTTRSATDIRDDEARLRGEVDPNGLDTEVWFEWGEGYFSLDNDTPKEDVGDGNSIEDFDFVIDNLDEDDTYYFRAVARNNEGTDYGETLHFRTDDNGSNGDGPEILDVDVDRIDEDSATLICEVDPNGEDTDVWFEWDEDEDDVDDGYGEETDETTVDENESSEEVRETITGLDEDTRYYFKCFAENRDGDDESATEDFRTDDEGNRSGDEPDVTTRSASDIQVTSAVLNGEVDPNGEDTDVWFEYGTSRFNLNRDTREQDMGDGTREEDFDERITGLNGNTTYYFRAVADSREGTDRGSILSFRTSPGLITPPTIITRVVERFIEREVEPEPELEGLIITLDADTTNIDRDEIVYVVSYDNRTDETFTEAELIVEIPNELQFIDADPREDDERGDDLYFTIGTISPGEEDSFVIETEVENGVDENDEIEFIANVHYTDDDTRKIVTVIDVTTLAEARSGNGFLAFIGGALGDFFTNPLLWLLILLAVIFFVYRYFANLARPREETVYVREPFQQQFNQGDKS